MADIKLNQLVWNILSGSQFAQITPIENQFYLVKDEYEGIKYIFTTSQSFTVPSGYKRLSYFLVGGGAAGQSYYTKTYSYEPGIGGGGGKVVYGQLLISEVDTISVNIGSGGTRTIINGGTTYLSINGTNVASASGGIGTPDNTTPTGSWDGADGVRNPFDSTDINLYGAGGAGGGFSDSREHPTVGIPGKTGGGVGGFSTEGPLNGGDGTFFGAGGGGASDEQYSHTAVGGNGYQGVAILIFDKG